MSRADDIRGMLANNRIGRFLLADADERSLSATKTLISWLKTAETKDDFRLFVRGIDANGVFAERFMKVIVQLSPSDPILKKAIQLGIIKPTKRK